LINIGGHLEKALHSDTLCATKSRRRAAETNLQRGTQAGRDWPVYSKYRLSLLSGYPLLTDLQLIAA
jgi:hypothetical protein